MRMRTSMKALNGGTMDKIEQALSIDASGLASESSGTKTKVLQSGEAETTNSGTTELSTTEMENEVMKNKTEVNSSEIMVNGDLSDNCESITNHADKRKPSPISNPDNRACDETDNCQQTEATAEVVGKSQDEERSIENGKDENTSAKEIIDDVSVAETVVDRLSGKHENQTNEQMVNGTVESEEVVSKNTDSVSDHISVSDMCNDVNAGSYTSEHDKTDDKIDLRVVDLEQKHTNLSGCDVEKSTVNNDTGDAITRLQTSDKTGNGVISETSLEAKTDVASMELHDTKGSAVVLSFKETNGTKTEESKSISESNCCKITETEKDTSGDIEAMEVSSIESETVVEKEKCADGVTLSKDSPGKDSSVSVFKSGNRKGQKLDQLLTKITHLAENDNLKATKSANLPKKAKARKSCVHVSDKSPVPSLNLSSTLTNLTFNVKELEKKGVLDMPKPSKRKAFEPVQVVKSKGIGILSPGSKSSRLSPEKSPTKLSGNIGTPFFRLKGRRKKAKRGGYKLPGEKKSKKNRKKESEERQLSENTDKSNTQNEPSHCKNQELTSSLKSDSNSELQERDLLLNSLELRTVSEPTNVAWKPNVVYASQQPNIVISTALQSQHTVTSPSQQNALDVLRNNSSKSFQSHPLSAYKKAKKSMRTSPMESPGNVTLHSYFKGGISPPSSSSVKKVTEQSPNGSAINERRKRKTPDIPTSVSASPARVNPNGSPEEKKRKVDVVKSPPVFSPQQMITLLPTGGASMGVQPTVIPSSVPGVPNNILLSPTSAGQTIIQNGTLNGLPMFQILNTASTSQQPQLVAFAQSPGKSLLNQSLPRTTTLLQPKGVPLLLMPTVMASSPISQTQMLSKPISLMTSIHSTTVMTSSVAPVTSVATASSKPQSVLSTVLSQPVLHLPNSHLMQMKQQASRNGTLPNGVYPVTPPKTPEQLASDAGSQAEVSPVGATSPDKDVIPLCTCKINGASFQKLSSSVTYCQAVDSVDGKVMGCCNRVTNSQLVRPAVKIPFLSVCDAHRKRLRFHQCCPGCGHFCTQGKFLQCRKDGSSFVHTFHEQCQVVRDGKNYCPHCGEMSAQVDVTLSLHEEEKPQAAKESKSSRIQTKARMNLAEKKTNKDSESEELVVSHTIEKTKKTLSTSGLSIGQDRNTLEKLLNSLSQERPKKYRHLPKCLYQPAYDKDLERIVYMLEDGHAANEKYEERDFQGAIHAAAAMGSVAIVHVLIQAGASPHLQDLSLRTPLMYAAENNHADVVRYLIKAGAIVDSKADDGMTSLHYAAKSGHVNIMQILLDTDRIKIDTTDDGDWTPLIWAAEHTQVEAVKFLLKRNSDPNLRDSEENTTLHWAAFSGSEVIAEHLLQAGCDVDSLNMHGDRPLLIAARQAHYECVVLFLARGADVEAKNNKGETAMECCIDQTSLVYLHLKVSRQLKAFGAKHMGRREKLLHRDLSKGRENIPIPCVNAVDDDGIPTDYLYVTDNIETTCLNINRVIGSLQCCQCKDDCSSMYCACGKNSIRCWYDKFGRLLPEFNMLEPPLIFECNRACECWTTCNNRVVQNGVMSRLQVFKTEGRGWGCRTLVDIQRGTFICEYIGEHISDSEADRREDDSYLFDLDNRDGETYCIDARKYGNIARFINHLCQPNLVPVKVFVDHQDLRFPRICLFAQRDIKAHEELGFDYGEKFWIIKWKQFTCTCGSPKCRFSSETIHKTIEDYRSRHEDDGETVQE